MLDLQLLNTRTERWQATRQTLQTHVEGEKRKRDQLREHLGSAKSAIALLQYVAQETTKANEDQTAALTTLALRETFDDQSLTFLVEQKVSRGQSGVHFKLRDEAKGVEGDPIESFGGGPAALIGLILQVISVVRQKKMARILILDEPFHGFMSQQYQEAAGKLLRKLCEPPPMGLGFKILAVTHIDIIAAAAHKRYWATDNGKTLILSEEKQRQDVTNSPEEKV